MGILLWIIFGALAGWIASMIVRTDQGLLLDIIVGIIGAVIGGFIFRAFGAAGVTGFNIYSLLVAILGAIVLLWIVKAARRA
ncbi:MAG TPA: GlsB/YeaQ/YmgE family stress response membrane protein [Trueperaceae bacterium]